MINTTFYTATSMYILRFYKIQDRSASPSKGRINMLLHPLVILGYYLFPPLRKDVLKESAILGQGLVLYTLVVMHYFPSGLP